MFADDTNITISGSSQAELEQETNSELLNLHCWLKANKLSLNVAKTEFTVIGSRQKLLAESHNEINIKLEDQVISKVDHAKSLGLIIDKWLSWSNHVNELCKKVTLAKNYKQWLEAGVAKIGNIFQGDTFSTFNDFSSKFSTKTNFLAYHGLCHTIPQKQI